MNGNFIFIFSLLSSVIAISIAVFSFVISPKSHKRQDVIAKFGTSGTKDKTKQTYVVRLANGQVLDITPTATPSVEHVPNMEYKYSEVEVKHSVVGIPTQPAT